MHPTTQPVDVTPVIVIMLKRESRWVSMKDFLVTTQYQMISENLSFLSVGAWEQKQKHTLVKHTNGYKILINNNILSSSINTCVNYMVDRKVYLTAMKINAKLNQHFTKLSQLKTHWKLFPSVFLLEQVRLNILQGRKVNNKQTIKLHDWLFNNNLFKRTLLK